MRKCNLCGSENLTMTFKDMHRCNDCKLFIKDKPLPKEMLKEQLMKYKKIHIVLRLNLYHLSL